MINKFSNISRFLACAGIFAIIYILVDHSFTAGTCVNLDFPDFFCFMIFRVTLYASILLGAFYGYKNLLWKASLGIFIPVFAFLFDVVDGYKYSSFHSPLSDFLNLIISYGIPIMLASMAISFGTTDARRNAL